MRGQQLDPIPVFDRLHEEPNLDLVITTRRVDEGDPQSGTKWEMKNRVEGEAVALTQVQRDYASAVLRLAAHHLSHSPQFGTDTERVLHEARESRWQMQLALDYFIGMLRALVSFQGVDVTARLLDMSPRTVQQLFSAPSSKRPNMLAEVGAFNVSRRERQEVAKTLASLALLPLADDRRTRSLRPSFSRDRLSPG